jgi:hypothetical protein
MTESLQRAELRTVADVAELSASEAAELFDGLRVAAIPLGDRARLRKVARDRGQWAGIHKVKLTGLTQNLQVDPAVCIGNPYKSLRVDPDSRGQPCEFQVHGQRAMVLQSGGLTSAFRTSEEHNGKMPEVEVPSLSELGGGPSAPRRRLQSGGGFSIEVVAIVATALLGMVG